MRLVYLLLCFAFLPATSSETTPDLGWSMVEWKTAEYKAAVTAAGSYEVVQQRSLFPHLTGDYGAQARAWKELCDLARLGAVHQITTEEFLAQRHRVYQTFGLPIPNTIHAYARYNTLLKWSGHPSGYPAYARFEDFMSALESSPEDLQRLTGELRSLACSRSQGRTEPIAYVASQRPQTEQTIRSLLQHLSQDAGAALQQFGVWFGNEEGGFASTLVFHLRRLSLSDWSECWHPEWKLVGSTAQQTALFGADLDVIAVLNPHPDDAVTFEWTSDGRVKNVRLKGRELTEKHLRQLWEAFWSACDAKRAHAHPGDEYQLPLARDPNYIRARTTLRVGGTTADVFPALRAADGSHLFLGIGEENAWLTYSNSAQAARIVEPYMDWDLFPEVVKCLKFLYQEEWNTQHPKVFGCMSETLAVDIAKSKGRREWEKASFRVLLQACLDRLLWYIESDHRLPALNHPYADLLPARSNAELVAALKGTTTQIRGYTTEEICDKLESAAARL